MDTLAMLKLLGEPTRLAILNALLERKHCVRSLARKLGITESAVSQHLKRMREAGLVYCEPYGYHSHYYPSTEALEQMEALLHRMAEQSRALNREEKDCQCQWKENENAAD